MACNRFRAWTSWSIAHLAVIRTEFGRFPRQVSGYSLEHLLPENGRNLAKALVGSEGTLGVVTWTRRCSWSGSARPGCWWCLGYPDMAVGRRRGPRPAGAFAARHRGSGCPAGRRGAQGQGRRAGARPAPRRRLVDGRGRRGDAWPRRRLRPPRWSATAGALDSMVLPAGPIATAMWQIRADGAGLAGRTPDGGQAWPGWEDAAVPPANLGGTCANSRRLMDGYDVTGIPYGHFGDGCVHIRIDLPLERLRQRSSGSSCSTPPGWW